MLPSFANALLLAGLAGIAAPILIHLLLRRKSQRMRFSTVQFFVKKDEQSMRKRKLRNLLLLAVRVCLFTLIVLAFARPFLRNLNAAAGTARRQQVILLLDSSASMQANGLGGQQWNRAKQFARNILSKLQADDRAALVISSTHSSTVSEFVPPSVLAQKIEALEPTYGAGELSEGLRQASKLLAVSSPEHETSLQIISDLQRSAAQNIATVSLPQRLGMKVYDPGERFIPNVAVTDLQLDGQNLSRAVVTSFSDENYAGLQYKLRIDGKEMSAGALTLPASAVTNLALTVPVLTPGWHSVEFAIQPKDAFAMDDARYATIFVPEPIHALTVEPRKGQKAFQEESFFVRSALAPSAGTTNVTASRFEVEKISPEQLVLKVQNGGKVKTDFVIVPGVHELSSAAVQSLKSYVEKGGGLLLFLGESVSANYYNSQLRGLLPAELGQREANRDEDSPWRITEFNKASGPFAPFRDAASGNLMLAEFSRRFALKPLPGSSVFASFDDDAPLVVERKIGEGHVVLINSSADTAWTDWQKHKTFVPWLHATGYFLSGRNAARETIAPATIASGSEMDVDLGLKKQPISLERQGAAASTLTTDEDGNLRDVPFTQPGIYSFKDATGREIRRVAVNLQPSESDLALFPPAEFEQQLVHGTEPPSQTLMAGLLGDPARGKELWRILLLAALAFLIFEPMLANKTVA